MAPKDNDTSPGAVRTAIIARSKTVTVECIEVVPAPEETGGELGARLAGHWQRREWADFWGIVGNELRDRIAYSLVRRGLTVEDAEDCIVQTHEKLFKAQEKRHAKIANPYGCLWTAAHRAANDFFKKKKRTERLAKGHFDHTGRARQKKLEQDTVGQEEREEDADYDIPADAAIAVAEAILDDLETSAEQARLILKVAINLLRPALAKVAKHMLLYGTDCECSRAGGDIDMKPETYRSNRSKAIAELKVIVPQVLAELGITLTFITPPDVFVESAPFPSGEDAE